MCAAVAEERRWAKQYPWLGEDPVPTDACISEDIYKQEVEKVFKKVWLHVGRTEELPEPGCYKLKRLDFASTTVLLIRSKDNQIRAFHNTCSHRGNTVVVPEGEWDNFGLKSTFSCRFHGWTYNDRGELIGAADEKGMPPVSVNPKTVSRRSIAISGRILFLLTWTMNLLSDCRSTWAKWVSISPVFPITILPIVIPTTPTLIRTGK